MTPARPDVCLAGSFGGAIHLELRRGFRREIVCNQQEFSA
jgi:hypothetical protein